jgi:hypothetical protein
VCCCDAPAPEFYHRHTVRGRKPHRCCECLRDIPVGEEHEVATGKWEGTVETFRTCADCVTLWIKTEPEYPVHGGLADELSYGNHDSLDSTQQFLQAREQNRLKLESHR